MLLGRNSGRKSPRIDFLRLDMILSDRDVTVNLNCVLEMEGMGGGREGGREGGRDRLLGKASVHFGGWSGGFWGGV